MKYEFKSPDHRLSVRELLLERGVKLDSPCGGSGRCGKCRVKVSGEVTPASAHEKELLGDDFAKGLRLACLTYPTGDFTAETGGAAAMKIMTDASFAVGELSPLIGRGYGLGVDIGTTTVAVYCVDLSDGRITGTKAFKNPQSVYGADVISRINYSDTHTGALEVMRDLISSAVEESFPDLEISYIVYSGNTVMEHIAAGTDPSPISRAPFTPNSLFGYEIASKELGYKKIKCPVYFMPCAASYVGGDILSGICATDTDLAAELTLYLDIGTNGELALGTAGHIACCACAAGPAFEGEDIECGSAGVVGAIDRVRFDEDKISYDTIGGAPAHGICGSAIIDVAAQLVRTGAIEASGFLEDKFFLDREKNIYLSPRDVRQIQLAKAAVAAGIDTLLVKENKTLDDILRVTLAGGFGSYIDRASACAIGLIPAPLEKKITAVGNASGAGAVKYLCSGEFRGRVGAIRPATHYIELSGDAVFMEKYVDEMAFGEL